MSIIRRFLFFSVLAVLICTCQMPSGTNGTRKGDEPYDVSPAECFTYVENNGEITINGFSGIVPDTPANIIIPPVINSKPVTTIADGAFKDNTAIISVAIPASVTSIGGNAFYNCGNLSLVFIYSDTPPCLTGNNTFAHNSPGRRIYVPEKSLGKYTAETGWNEYADAVTALSYTESPAEWFNYIEKDWEVTVTGLSLAWPPSETDIIIPMFIGGKPVTEVRGFSYSTLTSVIIPDTTHMINGGAFSHCGDLEYVVIGDSVSIIVDEAFSRCENLSWVCIKNTIPPYRHTKAFFQLSAQRIFYVPAEAVDAYKASATWQSFINYIYAIPPNSVQITSQASGTLVTGNAVTINADASGSPLFDKVEFYCNDVFIADDASAPYSYVLQKAAMSTGANTITVRGLDILNPSSTDQIIIYADIIPGPEMDVLYGSGSIPEEIPSGGSIDVGGFSFGSSKVVVLTIKNSGTEDLTIDTEAIDIEQEGAEFSVYSYPASVIAPSQTSELKILFSPSVPGEIYTGTVSIPNNDGDENPYIINLTGSAIDIIPPIVTITSPSPGETVSGSVLVSAEASDNHQISKVEFYVDNNLVYTDSASPYSFDYDTAGLPGGEHALKAIAYDTVGNTSEDTITFHIEYDIPVAVIESPNQGEKIGGYVMIDIIGRVSYDEEIDRVEFDINGYVITQDGHTDPYYELLIEIYYFEYGENTITIRAYNTSGDYGEASITVFYQKPTGEPV